MSAKGQNKKMKKGGKAKWVVLTLIVIVLIILTIAYIYVAGSYRNRFFPNSKINGIECGGMGAAEVSVLLTPSVGDYSLEVVGRNYATGETGVVLGRITAEDVNMRFDSVQASVEKVLAQQNEYTWLFRYLTNKPTEYIVEIKMIYDESKAVSLVQSWEALQEKNMSGPQNAYISSYSEQTNGYKIIPETFSTKLDPAQVCEHVIDALDNKKPQLNLEELGCYVDAAVTRDDKKLNDTVEKVNKWLSTHITYDWNGTEVILDKALLRDWISVVGEEPVLDVEQVGRFVKKQAAQYDTYGKDRRFKTTLGVTLVLPSGYYGWKTDTAAETEELIQLIYQGGAAKREPVYSSKARQKGESDIGSSYVEADLTHQHLYLYNKGQLVLETDFVSGDMSTDCDTPEGVFGIAYKTTNAVLRGADYANFVNYWMPYYNNYGMHDATWRDEFGGDIYLTNGSHGCLNLPLDMAGQIYQYMSTGFPVIAYYYDVDPLAGREEPAEEQYEEEEEDEE